LAQPLIDFQIGTNQNKRILCLIDKLLKMIRNACCIKKLCHDFYSDAQMIFWGAVHYCKKNSPTVCVSRWWAGVDSAWEQEKPEARKMLENGAESHQSAARFVGQFFGLLIPFL
jgi:hypothetical protein